MASTLSLALVRSDRRASAASSPFEPRFERLFIPGSYANRIGRGTHRGLDRLQHFARRHRCVLRADVVDG